MGCVCKKTEPSTLFIIKSSKARQGKASKAQNKRASALLSAS